MSEETLPTLNDLQAVIAQLIADGFGELPVQIVVAPDSTLQALARRQTDEKPALMIEYQASEERLPVCVLSTARLTASGVQMPSLLTQ